MLDPRSFISRYPRPAALIGDPDNFYEESFYFQ